VLAVCLARPASIFAMLGSAGSKRVCEPVPVAARPGRFSALASVMNCGHWVNHESWDCPHFRVAFALLQRELAAALLCAFRLPVASTR
jgi:hypothetical protein